MSTNVIPLFPGQDAEAQAPGKNPNDTFDPSTIVWVLDEGSMKQLLQAIATGTEVVCDLETSGLNEHETGRRPEWPVAARIALGSFTIPAEGQEGDPPTFVLPLAHPDSPWSGRWRRTITRVIQQVREHDRPMVNQHLKFDMRWLFACTGIDITDLFSWDTMYSSAMLDENTSTALKPRAAETFQIQRWDDHDLSTPGAALKVPLFDLGLYAARDTYWTWKLAQRHRRIMNVGYGFDRPQSPEEEQDWQLGELAVFCEMPKGAVLCSMEQRGLLLDRPWIEEKLAALGQESSEQYDALVERYPMPEDSVPSFAPTSLWFREWAQRAVDSGDLRVGAMTKSGNPQWSKSVLRRQARMGSEVAEKLLAYRAAAKQAEFLRGWLKVASDKSRIHATYWAGRVVTGRLSCSDPNLQQVTKALKPAFVPAPGYLIAEIDYSQIELRAAAFIARCEPMLEAYRRGDDLHTLFAARLTGKDPADVEKDERQRAKAGNFGLLYGMGPAGFQTYADDVYGVVLTEEEAAEVHEMFFRMWHGMAQWHARTIREAHRVGFVTSPIGRVRRLPDLYSGNDRLVSHAERNAINSPVQGFASDLMQMAAASIGGYLPGYTRVPDVRLVGTVHDSIVVEVPEDDWKRATARCMRRMIDMAEPLRKLGCKLDVPLAAEATVGRRWGLGDVGVIVGDSR